jgi:hypothetical protein
LINLITVIARLILGLIAVLVGWTLGYVALHNSIRTTH